MQRAARCPEGRGSTHHVLVVDDDADIREALSILLCEGGIAVSSAQDGAEALALLRAGLRPCVILLDLTMPVMDGREFRNEQLRDPALADIPVVVHSALVDAGTLSTFGKVSLLHKPASREDILAALVGRCACGRGGE